MKKVKFKNLGIFLLIVSVSQTFIFSTNAKELAKKKTAEIPDVMQPNTIIEYVDEYEYVIIQGGEYVSNDKISSIAQSDVCAEKEIVSSKLVQDRINEIGIDNIIKMEKVKPNKGTMVYYAADGRIQEIQISHAMDNSVSIAASNTCPNCGKYVFAEGQYVPNEHLPKSFMWGGEDSTNNVLTVYSDKVEAYGRFTNFTDTIGTNDNILKKGDVATRFHVDNPPYGKAILCKHKNYKITMYKRDVGCLPDAILDIWKTGVEFFGYEWEPNVSIYNAYYCYLR